MPWRLIKLELAPTDRFPNGSAARGYLLRLPLQSNGQVDTALHQRDQRQCTARRYWPNEPELSGYILRQETIMSIVEDIGLPGAAEWARFYLCAFEQGAHVEIQEKANGSVPLQVASIRFD